MPDITNAQAVRFCNEQVRPLADQYAQLYFTAKAVAAAWTAQGIGAVIPNTTDLIDDGSDADGRAPITGAKVNTFAAQVVTFIGQLEANSNAILNVLLQIAVNPER